MRRRRVSRAAWDAYYAMLARDLMAWLDEMLTEESARRVRDALATIQSGRERWLLLVAVTEEAGLEVPEWIR